MCVIIYKPKTEEIKAEEVRKAWETNPDGAGFAYVENNEVIFERGFMNLKHFAATVEALQDKELILHFRISTGGGINPQNTHPYKAGNISKQKGRTRRPVVCMNGVIYGQTLKSGFNDTASYVAEHAPAFKALNEDILNIIADATGAAWAAATPAGVLISDNFEYYDGLYYSNRNHHKADYFKDWDGLWTFTTSADDETPQNSARYSNDFKLADLISSKKLLRQVKRDKRLFYNLQDIVWFYCNQWACNGCKRCITECKTIKDLQRFAEAKGYY